MSFLSRQGPGESTRTVRDHTQEIRENGSAVAVAFMVAGGGLEPPTFGLCDLTHLSMRVGLYFHPPGMLAIQSPRLPPIPGINRGKRIGFFTYSSVHVWPFSAQHVSFLVLRPSIGWHAR
jgi:hypothetical protein